MAKGQSKEVEPVKEDAITTLNALEGKDEDYFPESFEDLLADFEGHLTEVSGSPWTILRDKGQLVGKTFAIVSTRFYEGSYGDAVAMKIMTSDPIRVNGQPKTHFVINDGSTGLYNDIKSMVTRQGKRGGFVVPNGLRSSTYEKDIVDGMTDEVKTVEATTYYIA